MGLGNSLRWSRKARQRLGWHLRLMVGPSGMISKWKSGNPLRELGPLDTNNMRSSSCSFRYGTHLSLSPKYIYIYIYIYMGKFRDIKLIPALSFYRLSSKHNRAFTYIVFLSFSRQTTVWQWTLPQAIVPNLQII